MTRYIIKYTCYTTGVVDYPKPDGHFTNVPDQAAKVGKCDADVVLDRWNHPSASYKVEAVQVRDE